MSGDELRGDPEGLLVRGSIELVGRMPWASNATFLAVVRSGEEEVPAVYKPREGERPLWDFPPGSLCLREVASYLVSEALGWEIVPATVLREGPLGEGMVQLFVDHDPEEHYLTLRDAHPDRFRRFAAFDVVVNNADRKSGHCIRDARGHVWGVDHGITFHRQPKLRTVIWDFAGRPLPAQVSADLAALRADLDGELGRRLEQLLDPSEVEAARLRVGGLLEEGSYPLPVGPRPYPWPYV